MCFTDARSDLKSPKSSQKKIERCESKTTRMIELTRIYYLVHCHIICTKYACISPQMCLDSSVLAGIPNQLTEDYVNLVGDVMYPKATFHYATATPAEGKVCLSSLSLSLFVCVCLSLCLYLCVCLFWFSLCVSV